MENRKSLIAAVKHIKFSIICIDNDVILGFRGIIAKRIVFGDCSMIASRSFIVNSLPANEVWSINYTKLTKN